jgi:hypothetical protein
MSDGREMAERLESLERLSTDPDAPHEALAAVSEMVAEMLVEASLDPASAEHRRAMALGYIAGLMQWGGDATLAVAGIVRPPVVA